MKKVILFGLFVFTISVINAQCTWDGGGGTNNWGDANNWGGDCDGAIPNVNDVVPTAGDAVVITGLPTTAGNVLTIDVNGDYTCGTLTLTGVGDNGGTLGAPRHTRVTVNVLAGNTLTPTGNVTITSGGATTPVAGIGDGFARLIVASTGTLDMQSNSVLFSENGAPANATDPELQVNGTAKVSTINLSSGNVNLSGAAGASRLEVYGATPFSSVGSGTVTATGTNDNTIAYVSTGNQTIVAGFNYDNIEVGGGSGTKSIITDFGPGTVVGDVDVLGGATLDLKTNSITGNGGATDISAASGATIRIGNSAGTNGFPSGFNTETLNAASTVIFEGAAQDVAGDVAYGNITISGTGTKTLITSNVTINGNLTITNGVFDLVGFGVTGQAGKTMDLQDGTRLALSGTNNFPTGFGTFNFNTTSTVDYDGAASQTVAIQDYANLDITGGVFTKTLDVGTAGVVGILDVEDGATLATDLSTGKFLRLISTGDAAALTAKIADLTDEGATGILSGDGFVCERDMDLTGSVGWNDWASPIENFKLASWYYKGWPMTGIQGIRGSDYPSNPFCSVLTYNAQISTPYYVFTNDSIVDKNDGWVRGPSITTANSPGTGFRLYTGERDRELEDIGTPAQGNVEFDLNYENASATDSEEGWNLVGNPYMCSIDFSQINFKKISDDTPAGVGTDYINNVWLYSNVDKGYYAFNNNTGVGTGDFGVTEDFTNYDAGATNGLIASHKSFWVKVLNANVKISMEEGDKTTSGTTYIKSDNLKIPKLRVQVQSVSNGFLSAGVIVRMDGAENFFEQYDSEIFKSGTATAPNLFFLSEDNKQLSINSIPTDVNVIPMQVEAGVSGDFELRFWDFSDIPTGSCITLEDKFTQEMFDVREEQSIMRTLSDTTTVARFKVHIASVLNASLQANTTCFGTNDGQVMVENLAENVIGLGLYDENDVLVYEDMVTKNKVWKDLAPGTYTVREVNTNVGCPSAFTTVEVFEPAEVITSFEKSADVIDLAYDSGEVTFSNTSTGATEYIWYFSDTDEFIFEANPTHTFTTPGTHDVTLLAHNGNYDCAVVYEDQVTVKSSVGIAEELLDESVVNARIVDGKVQVNMAFENAEQVQLTMFDVAGKEVGNWNFNQVTTMTKMLDLPNSSGLYVLKVKADTKKRAIKLLNR